MNRLLQVYLIPSAVIVSVIIGGGYGTGREIVEFFTNYGVPGGLKGLALAGIIFALVLAATFEFARVFRTYDYLEFFKALIGPFWILFEILYVLLFFLVLGVISSAAANVLEQEVGVPGTLGLTIMLTLTALVVGLGRSMVERILTFWFMVMYGVFITYFVQIIGAAEQIVIEEIAHEGAAADWWRGGLLYPMYNLAVVPVLLFSTRHIRTRGEALGVAATTAVLVILPALMFHLSYAIGYPAVLDQPVPNYWMIAQYASPLLLTAFVIALFGTLVQTGAGLIHGVIERLEAIASTRGVPLGRWIRGGIAVTALAISGLLGTLGIVDLIAQGYSWMGIGFALVYVLPVCTLGVWRVMQADQEVDRPA
jgi:uncharacterized membrane protein YkvI